MSTRRQVGKLRRRSKAKRVVCVSWVPTLAETRRLMLAGAGYEVTSVVGAAELDRLSHVPAADLLVLAHSIPPEEKQHALRLFRSVSKAPVLSLLGPHQHKLPEADYAVEVQRPDEFLQAVEQILSQ